MMVLPTLWSGMGSYDMVHFVLSYLSFSMWFVFVIINIKLMSYLE